MPRLLIILLVVAGIGIPNLPREQQHNGAAEKWYGRAESYYNHSHPTDRTDSLALDAYGEVIAAYRTENRLDSILWDSYYKAGILQMTRGDYQLATPLLRQCLRLKDSLASIQEAQCYLPALYAGNSYYYLNRYDSARYYFKMAEDIALRHPGIQGLERLYNTLGVINFETGNYSQSRNYFEKAIETVSHAKDADSSLLISFKSNLASALRKQNQYSEALRIYESLLPYRINQNELYQNIAVVYLATGDNRKAIHYLEMATNNDLGKLNNLALAYLHLERPDSARYFLMQALRPKALGNEAQKSLNHGLTFRFLGDLQLQLQQPDSALRYYQLAIQQMIYSYNDSDIRHNPAHYRGVFSVIELFETLAQKAAAFELRFRQSGSADDLRSALDSYQSAFQLSEYAERTYESDEARIMMSQRNYRLHQRPISICLTLFRKTGETQYLEDAFAIDEKNKAAVLSASVNEAELKHAAAIPDSLLAAESNLKSNISRLQLQLSQLTDTAALKAVQASIRDDEISLDTLERKFERFPEYQRLKFSNRTVSLSGLSQGGSIPAGAAVLSYHLSDSSLLIWTIRNGGYSHVELPINDSFLLQIRLLRQALDKPMLSNNHDIQAPSRYLYDKLIAPVEEKLSDVQQLMIIPDDELSFVPFETLQDARGKYLLRRFSVLYQYSCSMLSVESDPAANRKAATILAMAPFAGHQANGDWPPLPYSGWETELARGKRLLGANASKEQFLQLAEQYAVLHLATHAQANEADPLDAFIAFYPQHPDSAVRDRLYIPEIYPLDLSHTRLVILSACETGAGQLVRGEGLISLSRAFSYAGCSNTITSIWKADDKATAYICRRLDHYLEKGNSIAESLQRAKMDYLDDPAIESRYKTAAYWSVLRLTGDFEFLPKRNWTLWVIATSAFLVLIALYFRYRNRRSAK